MNKVEVGLAVAIVGVLLLVGCMIYYEQTNQLDSWLDEHPGEIPEFGPPVYDLRVLAVLVVVALIFCSICMLIPIKEDDEKQP